MNTLRLDPTRTTLIRQRFMAAVSRGFMRLKRDIFELLVEEDVFGLKPRHMVLHRRYAAYTSTQQLSEFKKYVQTQIDNGILKGVDTGSKNWMEQYIREAYEKGSGRAFDDAMKKYKYADGSKVDYYKGSRDEFLRSSFRRPASIERVSLLASRAYTDLKGVTQAMSTQMNRVLTDGMIQGKNPRELARELNKTIDKIGITRARMIARTETIRAHADGQLEALKNLGVTEVGVMVEWSTASDDLVCDLCAELDGAVMKIESAGTLIPRHPNCRCAWIPANVGEDGKGQMRGKAAQSAVDKSIKAEIPRKLEGKRSLAKQKEITQWTGADAEVGKAKKFTEKEVEKILSKVPVPKEVSKKALTDVEQKAINYYASLPAGESTMPLQDLLAGTRAPTGDAEEAFAKHFRDAAAKLPVKNGMGYRGLAVADTSEFEVGKFISGRGIESWTSDKSVGQGYAAMTRATAQARGQTNTQMVLVQHEGKFINPNKVILNPSGKELWRLDNPGYVVRKTEDIIQEGIGKVRVVTVEQASAAEQAQGAVAGLEKRLAYMDDLIVKGKLRADSPARKALLDELKAVQKAK